MKLITPKESFLSAENAEWYVAFGRLPDGRVCGVKPLLFHWTMHVGIDDMGYSDRYCFQTIGQALDALMVWDGEGDPPHWHRHPTTGRRRNPVTGEITENSW